MPVTRNSIQSFVNVRSFIMTTSYPVAGVGAVSVNTSLVISIVTMGTVIGKLILPPQLIAIPVNIKPAVAVMTGIMGSGGVGGASVTL